MLNSNSQFLPSRKPGLYISLEDFPSLNVIDKKKNEIANIIKLKDLLNIFSNNSIDIYKKFHSIFF